MKTFNLSAFTFDLKRKFFDILEEVKLKRRQQIGVVGERLAGIRERSQDGKLRTDNK